MGVARPLGDLVSSLQVVLSPEVFRAQVSDANLLPKQQDIWKNSLAVPTAVASVSAVFLLLHLFLQLNPARALRSRLFASGASLDDASSETTVTAKINDYSESRVTRHVRRLGGPVIFAFRVVRLLCVVTLLALSIVTVISSRIRNVHSGVYNSIWLDVGLCGVYVSAA
ncbi:hypothetical protein OBBRIDRAFT_840403 [Obba rivulosa]|uniref:Uncharacterized protein n=1 Tax=Obba rivulosa TaxID=1052685 RepID=A0A8E2AKL1_9APHY|nr:hypothetical protein OBBRIDRAFT_840403 [Obba rivulosa]